MKIRILYVIESVSFGGGQRAFAQLIQGLDKEKFEIFTACAPDGLFFEKIKGYAEFIPLGLSNRFNLLKIFSLEKIIRGKNIDIVHTQGARADFFGRLAAAAAKTPCVISTVANPVEGFDVHPVKRSFYIALDRLSEKFVDKFIVVTEILQKRLQLLHKIPLDKIIKIGNGIEIDAFLPSSGSSLREELHVERNAVVVAAIGRLVGVKGFSYFLRAARIVLDKCPSYREDIKFLIAGEGPLEASLKDLSEKLGLRKNVIFTGFRKDVKEVLSGTDIFVLSSLLEGQPIVLLEAMAMQKPIVATSLEGIRETIADTESALLVASGDPNALAEGIMRLFSDKEKAGALAYNARKTAQEKFNLKDKIREHEQLYEAMIRSAKG